MPANLNLKLIYVTKKCIYHLFLTVRKSSPAQTIKENLKAKKQQ